MFCTNLVGVPMKLRSDCGTETVEIYTVHTAFHELSLDGDIENSYKYGKSTDNQKIECFWSKLLVQYLNRWRAEFQKLESDELWQYRNIYDETALRYIYMPVIRAEVAKFRDEYNAYPMRYNQFSRLPSGPPYDNYFLPPASMDDDVANNDFSVAIDEMWIQWARKHRVKDLDPERYLDPIVAAEFDSLMEQSPLGPCVHVGNARDQYLFLRDCLHDGHDVWPVDEETEL